MQNRSLNHLGISSTLVLLGLFAILAAGCKDEPTDIGSSYFPDGVNVTTTTFSGNTALWDSNFVTPLVASNQRTFNLTWASPVIMVGRVNDAAEQMECWTVLRFPVLSADTLARVVSVKLVLHSEKYKYGDTSSSNIDLSIYGEGGGKVTDSMTALSASDLTPSPLSPAITQVFVDTAMNTLTFPFDSTIFVQLKATSFNFVIKPNATMTNVRAFTSSEGNVLYEPELIYVIKADTGTGFATVTRTPSLDLTLVKDQSITPAGEFGLRGGAGRRQVFNVKMDSLQLTKYSTVNNAVLVLKLDPANTRHGSLPTDTAGPALVELLGAGVAADTSGVPESAGVRDAVDPTIYRFQIRGLVEYWLRDSTKNFGFELRSGFATRAFSGGASGVEDYTLDRWTFFGSDATDPNKRPKLLLTHSGLK